MPAKFIKPHENHILIPCIISPLKPIKSSLNRTFCHMKWPAYSATPRHVTPCHEVSALLGRIPSAVGYQPTLATDLASLQDVHWEKMGCYWGYKHLSWRNHITQVFIYLSNTSVVGKILGLYSRNIPNILPNNPITDLWNVDGIIGKNGDTEELYIVLYSEWYKQTE